MDLAAISAIAARSIGVLIGNPSRVDLPGRSPLNVFVCPVRLPEGCQPPASMPCRVAAGAALDADAARNICLLEGIERYSLQFCDGDPPTLASAAMPGTCEVSMAIDNVRLGCSGQGDGPLLTDSRGCSVGADLADAAFRGLEELSEHESLALWKRHPEEFREVDPASLAALERLLGWLGDNDLGLRLFERRHVSGTTTYIGICASNADGRAATGSASGLDAHDAAIHACLEGVVAWFNLAALAERSTELAELAPEDRDMVTAFLAPAARSHHMRPRAGLPAVSAARPVDTHPQEAFGDMVRRWGGKVAVFDLSRPETGIVTARVMRLTG